MNPFGNFIEQAKNFQESLKKFQSELKSIQVTGMAGAGMVKVVMDGHCQTLNIEIEDELYQEGKSALIALVLAANNDAANKVKEAVKDKMSAMSSSFGLPPQFLSSFTL